MCNVKKTVMIPKRESYLTGITQGITNPYDASDSVDQDRQGK
jgi:hypothetical protein